MLLVSVAPGVGATTVKFVVPLLPMKFTAAALSGTNLPVSVLLPADVGVRLHCMLGNVNWHETAPSLIVTDPLRRPAPGLAAATVAVTVAALPSVIGGGGVNVTVVAALLTWKASAVAFVDPVVFASPV